MKREIVEEPGELARSTVTANLKAVRYSHVGLRSCRMCARMKISPIVKDTVRYHVRIINSARVNNYRS